MPQPNFRDLVNVQQDSSAAGNPVPDYSGSALYSDVACDITTVAGDETYRGRQLEAHVSHVVLMQYMPSVTPKMRLLVTGGILSGSVLNIVSVRPKDYDGRAPKLELYCKELAVV